MSASTNDDIALSRTEARAFKVAFGNAVPQAIADNEEELAKIRLELATERRKIATARGKATRLEASESRHEAYMLALRIAQKALERMT